MYTYTHTYLPTYLPTYIHPSIHPYIHTRIHTYIHPSPFFQRTANSEHDESFRPVDRTSLILAQWHSAQRLVSAPQSENSARPAWAAHSPPQPFIFFKLYGEGASITNLARGHLAILHRYDTATQPTRYEMCVGPEVPSSTPQGSSTLSSHYQGDTAFNPWAWQGPGAKQKVQSGETTKWEHRKMAGD